MLTVTITLTAETWCGINRAFRAMPNLGTTGGVTRTFPTRDPDPRMDDSYTFTTAET